MSKPIKMTQEFLDECRKDFEKALELTKLADGKLSFTKTFTIPGQKADVYFTAEAWEKMLALIDDFDKEVAWHGVARRGEDLEKNEYIISDILVYPQTVTAANVEMDTDTYAAWIMENVEDERFEHIRMQGHSHVNMAPNPSSVDLNHQEEILNMLEDGDFYIFMIWNKSLKRNIKVYDLQKNILFEDGDISVKVEGRDGLDDFLKAAKAMVKTKTYTPPARNYGGPYNPLPPARGGVGSSTPPTERPKTRIGAGWSGRQGSLYEEDLYGYGYYD